MVYLKDGVGMYLLGDSFRCLNEGDLIMIPPHVDFSFDSADLGDEYNVNISVSVLRFDKEWLNTLLNVFPSLAETVLKVKELKKPLSIKGLKWMKVSTLLDEMISCRSQLQPIKVIELLEQLSTASDCVFINDMQTSDPIDLAAKIERIDAYIETNFCRKVSLEDLARYVGMSRTYFCQFFKNHYNEGFSDYLMRLRVEKACVMLQTEKPMPVIASECGFKTVQYFTRAFKKIKGTTPGVFRRDVMKY